jgi:hypothetical protein
MMLFKTDKMTFEEDNFEIRVYYNDKIINVVAFLNNYPVNGFRHQIKIPKKRNVEDLLDKEPDNEFVGRDDGQ